MRKLTLSVVFHSSLHHGSGFGVSGMSLGRDYNDSLGDNGFDGIRHRMVGGSKPEVVPRC